MNHAIESIQGYLLTEENYNLVAKKGFGKKRQVIHAHMKVIIDLPTIDSIENKEVRYFLHTLESTLCSIVPLGVNNEDLTTLLNPLLIRKSLLRKLASLLDRKSVV